MAEPQTGPSTTFPGPPVPGPPPPIRPKPLPLATLGQAGAQVGSAYLAIPAGSIATAELADVLAGGTLSQLSFSVDAPADSSVLGVLLALRSNLTSDADEIIASTRLWPTKIGATNVPGYHTLIGPDGHLVLSPQITIPPGHAKLILAGNNTGLAAAKLTVTTTILPPPPPPE